MADTPEGIPITIDASDYGQLMLFYFPYCPDLRLLFADILGAGDYCFDLGANVGILAASMAQVTGSDGRVIAVEPNPSACNQLAYTANRFFPNQIEVVQAAIGGQSGYGNLLKRDGTYSESVEIITENTQYTQHADSHATRIMTIDELVARYWSAEPDRIKFIKVDIEGSEVDVIQSMSSLLSAGMRPMLLIEFHPEKCRARSGSAEEIRNALSTYGYDERRVSKYGNSYCLDRVGTPAGHENFLFATRSTLAIHPQLADKWDKS